MTRRLATVAVLGLAALAVLIPDPRGPLAADTVRIATSYNITSAGLVTAMERGFFKEEGIEPNVDYSISGAKMVGPLATGELDMGVGGVSAGLFNALAKGLDLRLVGDFSRMAPGYGFGVMVVRNDLAATITQPQHLKGRKVAFNAPGAPCHYMLGKYLEKGGLEMKDVDVTHIPFRDVPVGFERKAIDASCVAEPAAASVEMKGVGKILTPLDVTIPHMQVSVLMASPKLVKNPELLRRWLRAYYKGVRIGNEKTPEVIQYLNKYTKIPVPVLQRSIWTYADPRGHMNVESLEDQVRFYQKVGLVKEKVDIRRYIDESFLPK
ncbi:MAG: ABC transporter substrate-binding protein [Deltaproteobacteria bacterium]|nr:ABC transporter substrate-binding protein [Deltaproteobacteria bacterium]MBI3075951.1 ABC transporter substrate-binding protein [Deltaproteobacteria bacterium]